ncbi:hypothetical protein FSP39_011199 [Pinctada imbricata]|uniref:Down syndrome cell adhesion molecule-like protein Dscam2 n=1 Tax=Pinctada imbricata TaxID=66713 RepID=A0AA88YW14_PINIB|nr:hypothetical protein FSP39_011199 [Pinctada imbricata]
MFSIPARTTESPLETLRGPIFLSEPPSSLAFANTKGAKVPCTAFGRPAPVLDWVKDDGSPVDDIPGILQILPNNTLFFSSFDRSQFSTAVHTQTYRCVASNEAGTITSRTMKVKAVLVDDYKTSNLQLSDEWVMRGGTAVFKCIINPHYVKQYLKVVSWTQGTKPIYAGERVSILDDGELHIRDIRDADRYTTYRCVARNILTLEEKTSAFAYLRVHEPPAGWTAPTMDDVLRSVTVEEGDTAELPCVGSGNPLPKYRWTKESKPIIIDNQHFNQKSGNLLILNSRIEDSGQYMCNASNDHGSVTAITDLIITSPLSAVIDPTTQMIDSGQSAVFNCSASGHPIKTITWLKNGIPLAGDRRFDIQSETLLEISDINKKDQGMYQCIVKNDESSAQGTSQLVLGAAHPTFVDTFVDQYVQIGQRTSLRCAAAGNPLPRVNWTLDGADVIADPDVSVGSSVDNAGDVVSYVNISSVQIKFGGEYRCTASNDVGSVQQVGNLYVYGVPFVRPMKNITATANEPLSIRCYVAGYPVKTIKWSKDGDVLPKNHLQKVEGGILYIEKVQKLHDTGKYICTAQNSNGQGMSRSVFVNVLEPPVIDTFRFPRRKQGDRVVVSCSVSSGDQPLTIKWTKDGEPIPPDMGIVIQKLSTYASMLSIGDVNPKHNGNYTCHAGNAAAEVNFTAPLHVDVPPRWIIEPNDAFVILRGTVSLDCLTTGTPEPLITWKKANGTSPGNYEPIVYVADDNATDVDKQLLSNGTLVLRNAEEGDHGHYLCHSYNNVGLGLSKVVMLTVHIPARFEEPEKNYTVQKGQNITMDCQAIGDKPLSMVWSFNSNALSTGGNARRFITTTSTSRGKLSHLALRPAVREDTGFYVCTAKNRFGYDALTMKLTFLEPPEAPSNITLLHSSSRTVSVQWQHPYDGNSPILYYIVEYKVVTDVWQGVLSNVSVRGNNTNATLTNLHPAYSYNIRVRANNSIGLGSPGEQISVRMSEEAPSGPPLEVKVKAIGSESLKVTWMPPAPENQNGEIKGYYVGYKETKSPSRYIYLPRDVEGEFLPELVLHNLEKFTEYSVHVQAYNAMGRGPVSTDIKVFTLEDVPSQPPQGVQATSINSRSIKVIWSPPPLITLHGILQGYKILYKPVRIDEGRGEGVRSPPLYIRTQQDVPERPADIKALAVNKSSLIVAWKPPLHNNGVILRYNLYIKNSSEETHVIEVPPMKTNYIITDLPLNSMYQFQVSASTMIGEGATTQEAVASPLEQVAARIASFSEVLLIPWQHTLTLQCLAVGDPKPDVIWKMRGSIIRSNDHQEILTNGSLHITDITGADAANYSCKARNIHGTDEIHYAVSVQAPPKPPSLYVVATTTSTIQVNWKSGSNGGSPIRGFIIHFKKDHEQWSHVTVGSANRSHTAAGLLCGTKYRFYINAQNKLGKSADSDTITISTNGSTPIMPPQSMLLKTVNATSVDLDLTTWQTSGCPIRFFSVKYQVWGDEKWTEVTNSVFQNTTILPVQDLHPATWYIMKVTAHSDAGSTESQLRFATLTYQGNPITPIVLDHKMEEHFYENPYVMIPLSAGIVTLSVLIVAVLLYCKRRNDLIRLKESASNLRRDITAETSLMNDLDKRFNFDLDPGSNTDHFGKRNVNLLISLNSDENINGNNSWILNNSSSKTNSDNGSLSRSDDDGNINPYATFNQIKQVIAEKHEPRIPNIPDQEMDDISLEKLQAQTAMASPEPYVPFFTSKGDNSDVSKDPHPPLIPLKQPSCYDNQGLVLSPRKYASADQIHALFTQGPSRPHSTYGKSKGMSQGSSDEKGSQRQSIISSVTTVSSSRDELIEALENAKRNPPPPVLYESQPDSSSQPTDSSDPTEPGIVQFTQSPPRPNEQREASCEVHYTDGSSNKRRRREIESDTTECEASDKTRESQHPRRIRGKHRGKQRGHQVKRQIFPPFVPRAHSRTSTTSSEEVTYTFGGRDSPHSNSPSEGYLSYPPDSLSYPESDYTVQSKSMRRGRRTPHARVRYDTSLKTPGTDEQRPLVMAIAQPSMSSPAEEDEDAVSLLDRYYRPVETAETESETRSQRKSDKGYTEDFTLV